ncbi:MAG: hypothetical protein AAF960_01280 [Bacteroidota bacterium]
MKHLYYLCLLLLLGQIACNSSAAEKESTKQATPTPPATIPDEVLVQEIPLSAYAQQFFTDKLWHFDAAVVINNPEKSASYQGKWVNLKADHTLETGYYDEPTKTGSWILDEEKNIITILENGERANLSEWTIRTSSSSDDIMIWVGTKKYGLTNTQIKLLRHPAPPTK